MLLAAASWGRAWTGVAKHPQIIRRMCTSTRAMVLNAPNGILESQQVTKRNPSDGEVSVRVAACAVCHRDLIDKKGAWPFMKFPAVLGHEIAGVVEKVGEGVENLQVGDKVVTLHWSPCGTCPSCRDGRTTHCTKAESTFLGITTHGGYSQHVVVGSNAFVRAPPTWSAVESCSVQCTYGTVWHGAISRGRLKPGEKVLVTGASGGVGTAMVQIASRMGCEVVAVTSSASKEEYIRALGAQQVIVADGPGFYKHESLRGGVDMSFEAVGVPTFTDSLRSLKKGGRMVLIGNVTAGSVELKLGLPIIKGLEIIGSDSCTADDLEAVFKFLEDHSLRPNIHTVLPLHDAEKAHAMLVEKAVTGRVVLQVGEEW